MFSSGGVFSEQTSPHTSSNVSLELQNITGVPLCTNISKTLSASRTERNLGRNGVFRGQGRAEGRVDLQNLTGAHLDANI